MSAAAGANRRGATAGNIAENIDVLVPTCNRPAALAVTLTALGSQTWPRLRIVISDQSERAGACEQSEVQAVLRYLRATGRNVDTFRRLPRRGMAEQRAFLLAQARSRYCLFVDDDVILEPDLVARLYAVISEEGCGFVGSALHGLSHLGQLRPAQEAIEFWNGPVRPETVCPGSAAWARHHLHSAANLFHVQTRLATGDGIARRYKIAWVGGCVMFDTDLLRAAGGFEFWRELPAQHCGEDVLAQQRVMARYGGCAILPSGAYHMELPTTVTARAVDAPYVLPLDPLPQAAPALERQPLDGQPLDRQPPDRQPPDRRAPREPGTLE
jgi:glycosyltransferase involved in cell wall biosynthesis